jgi:hypothetical protein
MGRSLIDFYRNARDNTRWFPSVVHTVVGRHLKTCERRGVGTGDSEPHTIPQVVRSSVRSIEFGDSDTVKDWLLRIGIGCKGDKPPRGGS